MKHRPFEIVSSMQNASAPSPSPTPIAVMTSSKTQPTDPLLQSLFDAQAGERFVFHSLQPDLKADTPHFVDHDENAQSREFSDTYKSAIIDLRGIPLKVAQTQLITTLLERHHKKFVFIVDPSTPPEIFSLLHRVGTALPSDTSQKAITSAIQNQIRLQNILTEFHRRNQLIESLLPNHLTANTPLPNKQTTNNGTLLIAGKPGHTILSLINILSAQGFHVHSTFRPGQAMRALETNMVDGFIIVPESKSDPLIALARTMRRHPRYRSIATLAVCSSEQLHSLELPCPSLPTNRVPLLIEPTIKSLIQKVKLSAYVQKFLSTIGAPKLRGKRSRMWAPKALAAYLDDAIVKTDDANQHLNFVTFKVRRDENVNISSSTMLNQVGPLIHRIIRAEDFLGFLTTDQFSITCTIILNDNQPLFAEQIAGRITSIIRNTMFRDNQGNPTAIHIQCANWTRPKGLCVEETIAGLFSSVRTA